MTATGPLGPAADGAYLRDLLGVRFTDEQLAVVTAPLEPQLVIAGAGSGKTTVMAARVVHAIAFHGVSPAAVLGLTFTNKAASELAERVRKAMGRLASAGLPARVADGPGQVTADDEPTVSTYHAYAASLIKDHALRIGREPDARLLTEAGRWQLALRVAQSARGPFPSLDWQTATVAQYLLDLDGELAEHLASVDDVREHDRRLLVEVLAAPKQTKAVQEVATALRQRDELLTLVQAYRDRKAALDLVDFGDQVALAAEIARSCPEVGEGERSRFAVVFLDEYQDTGVAQRVLLSSLYSGGHPVTAVGDPCQSIYGWRGASIGNLLRFGEHFPRADAAPVAPLELLTSFRNGEAILRAANLVSTPLRDHDGRRRRPHVPVNPLTAGTDEPGEVRAAVLETALDEAAWLADRVCEQVEAGTPPGEVAVLCRRRSDFGILHRALVDRGLPVEVVGLGGLLEMPEVADVVAVLEVLADPIANAALVRLLTGPRFRIGPRDLKALGARASALAQDPVGRTASGHPLAKAAEAVDATEVVALTDALESLGHPEAYSPEGHQRLRALQAELTALRPLLTQPVVEAALGVIRATGLDVEIEAAPPLLGAAMAANLAAFLDHAARFEGIEGESDLSAFLAYLTAATAKEDGLDVGGVSTADTVKLMTVHKAKGLEWDVVALPCLVHKVFPTDRGRPRWTSSARTVPYSLRGDCDDLPVVAGWTTKDLDAFKELCAADSAEEERRLAYVGVTRARRLLLASGHRWGRTRKEPGEASAFLDELRSVAEPGVDPWVEQLDAEANPLLAAAEPDVPWPAPYRPDALARRQSAAELVIAAMAGELPPVEPVAADRREVEEWDREVGQLLDELAATRSAVHEVVLPRTLSTSQVVALAQDEDAFARSLARPMPRKPSAAARRGTAFHAWVEQLAVRPLFDTDELAGAADDELVAGEPDVELAELQQAFARTEFADRTPYAVEAPFELVVGGRLLRGRIDAVYRTDDGFDVVDWKTGLRPSRPRAVALQLAIYRLAWAGIAGVPVEAVGAAFLYVASGELVRPPLADLDEIAALLGGAADVAPPARVEPTAAASARPQESRSAEPAEEPEILAPQAIPARVDDTIDDKVDKGVDKGVDEGVDEVVDEVVDEGPEQLTLGF